MASSRRFTIVLERFMALDAPEALAVPRSLTPQKLRVALVRAARDFPEVRVGRADAECVRLHRIVQPHYAPFDCPRCDGVGHSQAGRTCPRCDGAGRLIKIGPGSGEWRPYDKEDEA